MARAIVLALLPCASVLLAACTAPPPAPPPASAPSASETPSFDLDLDAEASLLPSSIRGEWLVIGLARAGSSDVDDPRLSITLRDEAGAELDRRTVEIPPDPLPASDAWPFRESFRLAATPSSVEVRLLGNAQDPSRRPIVEGEVLRTFLDSQGRMVALGALSNHSTRQARIAQVRLLGRGPAGSLREVLDVRPAIGQLEPGQVTPFLTPLSPGAAELEWEVYPIAESGDGSAPAIEILAFGQNEDDQGHPFVTAILRNRSAEPRSASITGILEQGGTWLLGEMFDLPVVLGPGEDTAISIRVPGLGPPRDVGVDWLLVTDSTTAGAGPILVASEVVDYRPLGSTLLLRVRLTAGGQAVRLPAAQASLIGEDGSVMSAAWGVGPPLLSPGESAIVPLAMPLPRGYDLTQGQLDVRAAGLP